MTAIALPRMPALVDLPDVWKLVGDIRENLGYRPIQREYSNLRLLAHLSERGTMPFVPEAVAAYQREKLREARGWKHYFPMFTAIKWRSTPLHRYDQPIPLSILKRCADLRRSMICVPGLGEIHWGVSYLADRDHDEGPEVFDPFIFVRSGENGPRHYIEVWDEPGFALS